MTQPDKQKELELSLQKLKRAAGFAEALTGEPVRAETCLTLWQLTTEAHSQVTKLKSIASGNDEPKIG